MSIERWHNVESLFHSARTLKPEQRRGYLESACGGDQELLREVESLVANDELAAEFLETDDPDAQAGARKASVPPGEKIGPYVILEFLKAGGMGEVHKARDTRLDRVVAIKFEPRALADDPAALSRIQREARAASALNHPRICTVHDMGEHQGRPFFVMEYLEGQSLRERLGGKAMALPELTDLAVQICDALQAAHAKGIVHRDIKPGNIFILANGQIKILDFGLAKSLSERVEGRQNAIQRAAAPSVTDSGVAESAITQPGTTAGTVAYMSPEQLRGEAVDARTDLFSFGVTLYQMATGTFPFQAETLALLRETILNRPPVAPREVNPALPVELERIILMCLQKERSDRYASAADLLVALEDLRVKPSHRRRWVAAAVAALAAALGLAAGAKLGWFGVASPVDLTPRQVTANPPEDPIMQASLSPDGQTMAYADFAGIHLRPIGGGQARLIAPPAGYCYR